MGIELIRRSEPADETAIRALYPAAFPEEDLLPLVSALLAEPQDVLSLVCHRGGDLAGHLILTTCGLAGDNGNGEGRIALLGPLAVAPAHQRQGMGRLLIADGFKRTGDAGGVAVVVLGDPAYYGRFGFTEETRITPPYPLPDAWRTAWQSRRIDGASNNGSRLEGTLVVPRPWREPALWGP